MARLARPGLDFALGPYRKGLSFMQAVATECALTFALCTLLRNAPRALQTKHVRLPTIGILVPFIIRVGCRLTGASMNPILAFALAASRDDFTYTAVYLIGPFLGSLLAGSVARWCRSSGYRS
mmetsp:Transcript_13626/g.27898  ORF Transcript_13626/g.27898 Transcript_13626/m.27898 type:complete len:123 (+) Transcript_13626:2262-2630(+)